MRARTVSQLPNRLYVMLDAITNPKKQVGRTLAVYFYNKFVLNAQNYYSSLDLLNHYLHDLPEDLRIQISNLSLPEIYPYVNDDYVLSAMQGNEAAEDEARPEVPHLGKF